MAAAAGVFLAAFPESVEHYAGRPIRPDAIADAFRICLDAEPGAFIVAVKRSQVSGYIFAPSDLSRLLRTTILRGHLLRLLLKWITGRYGLGLRPVRIAARNWIYLWRESLGAECRSVARILSVAVAPEAQGAGVGSGLVKAGLDYLRSRGAETVRLEVRPGNEPARHIYEKFGFRPCGRTRDTQGEWLVMVNSLS